MDAGDLLAELRLVAGTGQADLAEVELDVEVRVVDPVGPAETERHHDEALPQWSRQVQPRLEDLAQPVEGELTAGRLGRDRAGSGSPTCPTVVEDSTLRNWASNDDSCCMSEV